MTRAVRASRLAPHLRALSRLAMLSVATLGHFARLRLGSLALFIRAASSAKLAAWHGRCTSDWARTVARIVGMRVTTSGGTPPQARLIVANHLSYMDIVAISTVCTGAFVAKSEVARWPLFGTLAKSVGTLFVDRVRPRSLPDSVERMSRTLSTGRNVILFPEATSSRGTTVLPFRAPLLEVAARGRLPVTCASLSYSTTAPDPPADLAVCWWGDMKLVGHLYGLLKLRGFDAVLSISDDVIVDGDRKRLAARLHAAVCRLRDATRESHRCLAQTS